MAKEKIVARGYFDEKPDDGLVCPEPTLTVQAAKDECDINYIVARYLRTGELPGARQAIYADISEMTDLREAMHLVNDAMQAFMELPAEVRREFDNDPTKLVDFAQDPRNAARAVELGLASPRQPVPDSKPGKGPGGVNDASPKGSSQPAKGGSEQPST